MDLARASPSSSSMSSELRPVEEPPSLLAQNPSMPLFTPYTARVPWHTGPRAFFSHLFPKYGHYCGPNWSSGKNGGSLTWDKRPIDWLDHCCYCHDIGYDSHDQADLYKADLALLDCLEKSSSSHSQTVANGPGHVSALFATAYRGACTAGLRIILLPYRRMLLGIRKK